VRRRGVTLIETMVGTAILSVLLLAIMALAVTAGHSSRQAERKSLADNLAQNTLELYSKREFDTLQHNEVANLDVGGMALGEGASATVTTEHVPGYGGKLFVIEVEVNWEYKGVRRKSIRILRRSAIGSH
jgi:prepilin-type N-terminal cleavage/methylation domain-containing protein